MTGIMPTFNQLSTMRRAVKLRRQLEAQRQLPDLMQTEDGPRLAKRVYDAVGLKKTPEEVEALRESDPAAFERAVERETVAELVLSGQDRATLIGNSMLGNRVWRSWRAMTGRGRDPETGAQRDVDVSTINRPPRRYGATDARNMVGLAREGYTMHLTNGERISRSIFPSSACFSTVGAGRSLRYVRRGL
jgi:hypothetical protein